MNFDYVTDVEKHIARLSSKEQMLGKGLNIPFNPTNSGSRKIMNITHQEHALVLSRGELSYIGTGYENEFGDRSSSIITADRDYQVVAKISKFSFAPNHDYYLILADSYTNTLHVIHRVSYEYKTEIYGFLINNSILDSVSNPGSIIHKDTLLVKSTGFDEFDNKTNGANLNVMYESTDNNMEDSVIISDVCSQKMAAPLFHKIRKIINENDIPLNLYGNSDFYKVLPNVGEQIKDGILCAFRREDKDDAIYTQSVVRLQQNMMSDEKITLSGTVIDLDIYCNNVPNIGSNIYNTQFNFYFNERQRMNTEIVKIVSPYVSQNYELSYELEKLYFRCKEELSGVEFIDKRRFSNIILDVFVMDDRALGVGDKVADRYGGKGVVSKIVPQKLMPQLPNGQYADMIKNSSTMNNRENPGQLFELSINYISMCILDYIRDHHLDAEAAMEYILRFYHIISPEEETDMREYISTLPQEDFIFFVGTILDHDCIHVSTEPISDEMNIDLIGALYEEFSWIKPKHIKVPVKDSNGNFRFINSRKEVIIAKQYILRLKQLSEEKFSATSLSSTNIKNENAKSKASKSYKEPYSNAPIRFGHMETGDFMHMGSDIVIVNLMMYSLSPHGRRLVEEMYVGDPYDIDIKLNSKARNRSVEQLNAKLKTMGYRMIFNKIPRTTKPLISVPLITFEDDPNRELVVFHEDDNYDYNHYYNMVDQTKNVLRNSLININLVHFSS